MQFAAGDRRGPDGVAGVGGDARSNKHQFEHNTALIKAALGRGNSAGRWLHRLFAAV
jgi:hypothetical protein